MQAPSVTTLIRSFLFAGSDERTRHGTEKHYSWWAGDMQTAVESYFETQHDDDATRPPLDAAAALEALQAEAREGKIGAHISAPPRRLPANV